MTPPKSRSIIAPCVCLRPASAPSRAEASLPLVSDPLPLPPSRTARLHRSAAADPIRRRRDDGGRRHRPRRVGPAVPFGGCLLRRLQLVLATGIHRRHASPPTWLGVPRSQLPGRRAELPQHRPVLGLHSRRSAGRGSRNPSRSCQPHSRRPQDQWRVEPTGSRWRRARPTVGLRMPCEFHPTGTSRRFPCYWPCRRTGGRTCGRTGGWRSSSWRQCCVRPCCRL